MTWDHPLCQLWDHPDDPPTPAEKTFGWASEAAGEEAPWRFGRYRWSRSKRTLRRWLKGEGERPIAHGVGIDRKTARRYIAAARELGVERTGGEEQLSDELIGQVLERVRPHRPDGHGEAWRTLLAEEARIKAWLKDDLTVTKIGILLARCGVEVPAAHPGPLLRRTLRGGKANGLRAG